MYVTDSKELKRQRNNEYVRNKDEILKRRRQSRENKKTSATLLNHEQNVPHTPMTDINGQENETQTPFSIAIGNHDHLLLTSLLIDIY
jgi:hypothetical protein